MDQKYGPSSNTVSRRDALHIERMDRMNTATSWWGDCWHWENFYFLQS